MFIYLIVSFLINLACIDLNFWFSSRSDKRLGIQAQTVSCDFKKVSIQFFDIKRNNDVLLHHYYSLFLS